MSTKREYIIKELMNDSFIEKENNLIYLEEMEDSGKSQLNFRLSSKANFSIKNVDNKKTQLLFFKSGSDLGLYKRVDHIVFEQLDNNEWRLHLVEMKSSVGHKKWKEVKAKFRVSYLLSQGISAMLEMKIVETYMYTTYEKVDLGMAETNPSSRRVRTGEKIIKPEEEWNGTKFGLDYGERISFVHIPIQMTRNSSDILVGAYNCNL